jgi:adenylate kinase family enzyme
LGWTHLSTGELLREAQQNGDARAAVIDDCLEAGQLVPNEIVVTLLQQAMERMIRTTGKTNFLLDGFPRSLNNLEAWYDIYGREAELPKMLYLECPYEILEQRILGRAQFTGRSDDNIENLRLRFETFKAETLPTVDLFRNKDLCVEIDTSQSRQAVYAQIKNSLAEFTHPDAADRPLTEKSEMLLGLRPFPKKQT